jgi:hypothetical protein
LIAGSRWVFSAPLVWLDDWIWMDTYMELLRVLILPDKTIRRVIGCLHIATTAQPVYSCLFYVAHGFSYKLNYANFNQE